MIDIIIPVYNVKTYLETCVRSVLKQNFTDWNAILVDDGSSDGSGDLCDTLAAEDSRIRCIHKTNGGLSSARNAGLENASGDYVLFLDSDDALLDGALYQLYRAAKKSQADIVCAGYKTIDESGRIDGPFGCYDEYLEGQDRFTFVENHTETVMACGKLFKRAIWNTLRFPDGKLHEDVFVYHKYANLANVMLFIGEPVFLYRKRSDSITGKNFGLKNFDAVEGLKERVEFFKEAGNPKLEQGAAKFVSKYFLFLIHKMNLRDRAIRTRLMHLYISNARTYPSARIRGFKLIVFAYKTGIFKKPFFSTKLVKTALRLKKVARRASLFFKLILHRLLSPGCFVLISTPTHGNLGDQAIVMAERKFLKEKGGKRGIFEIDANAYRSLRGLISPFIKKNDIIVIDGGGNIGSIWPYEARRINDIVLQFPNNKIVIFPETAFFEDTPKGIFWFEKTKKVFSSHSNLFIFLRDESSLSVMQSMLPFGKLFLCPDIVLFLRQLNKKTILPTRKAKILLCLRDDQERGTTNIGELLEKYLSADRYQIQATSTVLAGSIARKNRRQEVEKKIREFHEADFVITDRMHGMLFAYLAQTPCVAFDNTSGKVKGQFKWIDKCGFIRLALDTTDFESSFEGLSEDKPRYNTVRLDYSDLESALREHINGR